MATNQATKKMAKSAPRTRKSGSPQRTTVQAPKDAALQKENAAVKVRMYRQGLGDCFFVTLPRTNGKPYYLLIDCGVIIGTSDAASKMESVVNNVIAATGGHLDLLVITHEHWDHLSGFVQAKDLFAKLKIDKIWFAWTEDPNDALAKKLRSERQALRMALTSACARLRLGGAEESGVDGLMEFFGAAGQGTTGEALTIVKGLSQDIRYCRPADAPVALEGVDARVYVLGPPHDETLIKRFNPSKTHPETYGAAGFNLDAQAIAITDTGLQAPFDPIVQIPLELAQQLPFFQEHYWGKVPDAAKGVADPAKTASASDLETAADQAWRRIDTDWLAASTSLALQLDSATNNTSLVLAIELGDGKVLLFAGDAQVGNWLSWQDLLWIVEGKTITGPDLLKRTHLYKTGHHGSHNATLREKGLEMMSALEIALIPVDHEMALKKGWGQIPLEELEQRLNVLTKDRVLRIDKEVPPALTGLVGQDDSKTLYYEVTVQENS
jgi:beta-lactamase superfamily II metal-dependent hydrolase